MRPSATHEGTFAVAGMAFAAGMAFVFSVDLFQWRPADIETHYAPSENLEQIDVALIDAAQSTLDVAAYVLTDIPVIEALAGAGARGVRVRIYRHTPDRERDPGAPVREALTMLDAMPNVEQRFKPATDPYMHLKSYCVDGETLRSGAANFSASGLKRQDNDIVIVRGRGACARFAAAFERMWTR